MLITAIEDETQEQVDKSFEKRYTNQEERNSVNHPFHYSFGKFECIDVLEDVLSSEQFQGFCLGNVLKYCWRSGKKKSSLSEEEKTTEDLKKAAWYLNRLISHRLE